MKVNATIVNNYVSDIKIVDIDVISEEEAQLIDPGRKAKYHINPKALTLNGPFRGFFVIVVLTFTGSDLPVGTSFIPVGTESSFMENKSWKVYKENKAFRHFRFSVDEYEENEAKLKARLCNNRILKNIPCNCGFAHTTKRSYCEQDFIISIYKFNNMINVFLSKLYLLLIHGSNRTMTNADIISFMSSENTFLII